MEFEVSHPARCGLLIDCVLNRSKSFVFVFGSSCRLANSQSFRVLIYSDRLLLGKSCLTFGGLVGSVLNLWIQAEERWNLTGDLG